MFAVWSCIWFGPCKICTDIVCFAFFCQEVWKFWNKCLGSKAVCRRKCWSLMLYLCVSSNSFSSWIKKNDVILRFLGTEKLVNFLYHCIVFPGIFKGSKWGSLDPLLTPCQFQFGGSEVSFESQGKPCLFYGLFCLYFFYFVAQTFSTVFECNETWHLTRGFIWHEFFKWPQFNPLDFSWRVKMS